MIWFNFILKISPGAGPLRALDMRLLDCLGGQHCMADWHRQVTAIKPAGPRDEPQQSRRATEENQTSCVPFDRRLAASIRPAPVEKVSVQANIATAELAARMRAPSPRAGRPAAGKRRRPEPFFSPENAPPSALAKAGTERVERRTSESGDLHNPAPADCPDICIRH
jgi:hypothetical protein